ncbi:MAG: hypothetical protein ACYC4R_07090 [Anaerolineae bacterium]
MWEDVWPAAQSLARPSQDERVLVAVVPSAADWERIRREGWYRIPVAKAPSRLGAAYLAFYHTAACPALRWSIRFYAPTRRYRILPRRVLLPEEPDHPRADAFYYRVELGPLEALPEPIPSSRLRRITFIHTTLPRLLQAREVSDLWEREASGDALRRVMRLGESPAPYACAAA